MNERLKELREAMGLNQTEFAKKLHLSPSNISNWERGAYAPGDPVIALICQTFGVSEVWLREGTGPMLVANDPDERMADDFEDVLEGKRSQKTRALIRTILDTPDYAIEDFVDRLNEVMEELKNKNDPAE